MYVKPQCPVDAIIQDSNDTDNKWYDLNYKWLPNEWPNITSKDESQVPEDAEEWANVKDKMKYFSEKPGAGD